MSNMRKVAAFFEAYGKEDIGSVREILAEDVVWTIPGHHPLAGPKRGVDEVLAFFDQLAKAGFKAQPLAIVEAGEYVIDHHRGWSEAGSGLDVLWCLVFRFANGRIQEVTNFCADQHRADLFFNSFYRLAPIPQRLAN
jgi:ketosteroid isomerase-like protein